MGYFLEKLLHLKKILFYLYCDPTKPPTVQITHKSILITDDSLQGLLLVLKRLGISVTPNQPDINEILGYFHTINGNTIVNNYFYKLVDFDCQIDAEDVSIHQRGKDFIVYSIPIEDDRHVKEALASNDSDDLVFPQAIELHHEYYAAFGLLSRCCYQPLSQHHSPSRSRSSHSMSHHEQEGTHDITTTKVCCHTHHAPTPTPSPITSIMPLPSRYWEDISEIWFCHNDMPSRIGVDKHDISVEKGRILLDRSSVVCHSSDLIPIYLAGGMTSSQRSTPFDETNNDMNQYQSSTHYLYSNVLPSWTQMVPSCDYHPENSGSLQQQHHSNGIMNDKNDDSRSQNAYIPTESLYPLPWTTPLAPKSKRYEVYPSSFLEIITPDIFDTGFEGTKASLLTILNSTPTGYTGHHQATTTSVLVETTISVHSALHSRDVYDAMEPIEKFVCHVYLVFYMSRYIQRTTSSTEIMPPPWIHFLVKHCQQLLSKLASRQVNLPSEEHLNPTSCESQHNCDTCPSQTTSSQNDHPRQQSEYNLYLPISCGCSHSRPSTSIPPQPKNCSGTTIGEALVALRLRQHDTHNIHSVSSLPSTPDCSLLSFDEIRSVYTSFLSIIDSLSSNPSPTLVHTIIKDNTSFLQQYHMLQVRTQIAFHQVISVHICDPVRLYKYSVAVHTPIFATNTLQQDLIHSSGVSSSTMSTISKEYFSHLKSQARTDYSSVFLSHDMALSLNQESHESNTNIGSRSTTPTPQISISPFDPSISSKLTPVNPLFNLFHAYSFETTIASMLHSLCLSRISYRIAIVDPQETMSLQLILVNSKLQVKFPDAFLSPHDVHCPETLCLSNHMKQYDYPKYAKSRQTLSCVKILYKFTDTHRVPQQAASLSELTTTSEHSTTTTTTPTSIYSAISMWSLLGNAFQLQWDCSTIHTLVSVIQKNAQLLPMELRSDPKFNAMPLFRGFTSSYLLRSTEYLSK